MCTSMKFLERAFMLVTGAVTAFVLIVMLDLRSHDYYFTDDVDGTRKEVYNVKDRSVR